MLIRRIAGLETRLPVYVEKGPGDHRSKGDADQIEQLLINLTRNAVDAALLTGGGVGVELAGWPAGAHSPRGGCGVRETREGAGG